MKRSAAILAAVVIAIVMSGCMEPGAQSAGDPFEQRGFVRTGATEYVKPNAYGLGTGMNQFGAPVKTVPANGY